MSTISGHGTKGDKNKGKYTAININSIYKGTSTAPQQKSVTARQHGLQSLGKVASARRMPPPAHLPSLRSENSGNDPNINLVPTGGSGWAAKEKEGTPTSQPPSSQPSPATAQFTGQNAQKTTTSQPATPVAAIPVSSSSNTTSGGASNNGGTPGTGGKSWSSVTMGEQKRGGAFLDQQSSIFQEEFPRLTIGGDEKSPQPSSKPKEEGPAENREAQYGPGPSLRPQNVGSWREGGGRGAAQLQQQQEKSVEDESPQNGPQMSGGSAEIRGSPEPSNPPASRPSPGMEQPPRPVMPMPYRGMPPHYMYRPGYPGFPPQFGMRPPFPYPERFRGPPPQRPPSSEGDDNYRRPAIVKDRDLKEFDEILKNDESDGGWAGAQGEIDYSEKLVFSDDEGDGSQSRDSKKNQETNHRRSADGRGNNRDEKREKWDNWEKTGRPEKGRSPKLDRSGEGEKERDLPPGPREAWAMHMGPHGPGFPPEASRMPPWQRMPFDPRAPMPFAMYRMRGPPPSQRMPFPGPPPPPHGQRPGIDQEEDEMWRQRQRQTGAEVSAAVERARQKREEGEKRVEGERKRKDSDGRDDDRENERDGDSHMESGNRSRTASEGSDKDRGRHQFSRQYARNVPPRFLKQNESGQKPPTPDGAPDQREIGMGGPPQPSRTSMRQGPPWAGYDPRDPRSWAGGPGGFPPPWAMGGRPPMDMPQAMYEEMRRNMPPGSMPYFDPRGYSEKDRERSDSDREREQDEGKGHKRYERHPSEEKRERSGSGRERSSSGYSDEVPPRRRGRRETDEDDRPPVQKDPFDEEAQGRISHNRTPPSRGGGKESGNRYGVRERDGDYKRDRDTRRDRESQDFRRDRDSGDFRKDRDYGGQDRDAHYRGDSYDSRKETDTKYAKGKEKGDADFLSNRENHDFRKERGSRDFRRDRDGQDLPREKGGGNLQKDREGTGFGRDKESREFQNSRESKIDKQDRGTARKQDSELESYTKDGADGTMPPKKREDRQQSNKERSERQMDYPKQRRENVSAPPPISAQQARENILPKSNLTSLKRTHSNISTGSTSSDRKTESPKESWASAVKESEKPTITEEAVKESSVTQDTDVPREEKNKENVEPTPAKATKDEQGKGNKSETDSQNKVIGEKNPKKEESGKKEDKRDRQKHDDKPPVKRLRDDESYGGNRRRGDDGRREDNRDRSKSSRGRGGREFVRGGRGGRGRSGYSSARGRSRGRGDQYYEPRGGPRFSGSRNTDRGSKYKDDFPDPEVWDDPEPVDARRRTQDGDSDVSADETSATPSESSGERTSEPKELVSVEENEDKTKNESNTRKDKKTENGPTQRGERRGDRKSNRGRGRSSEQISRKPDGQDHTSNNYIGKPPGRSSSSANSPWGEPPRRGRGGSGSRGRGGRYFSAPPKNGGGLGRHQPWQAPPDSNFDNANARGENKENRNDSKRQERMQQAPRFSRSGYGNRGRGYERVPGRGRGRGGGRPNSRSQSAGNKRPALTKQNSSDPQNEEWETASESSDVLDRKDKEPSSDRDSKDRDHDSRDGAAPSGGSKKSFSRQRPSNDRQNRHNNSSDNRRSGGGRNFNKDKSPTSKSGGGGQNRQGGQGRSNKGNPRKENVNTVYNVGEVVHDDPTAIRNAINNLSSKSRPKNGDLTDVSKPLKSEKEKKSDALANIDINNYASVVVIDDQPEVSIDDPAFLFESNDGFQEVTSRKAMKVKAKAAQEEALKQEQKKQKSEARKKDKESGNKGGKGGGARSSEKSGRMSKLPPRLAKQREQKADKNSQETPNFMPKIENWDNEMANNIPTETSTKEISVAPIATGQCVVDITPAPVPMVNAWDKRITITSNQPVGAPREKFEKGEHHDSGYASEPPNSTTSSTRSSPSAEKKLHGPKHQSERKVDESQALNFQAENSGDAPKPQRQGRGMRSADKVIKKPESSKEKTTIEPIQLPPSFNKESVFKLSKGDESSDIKLDFTFNQDLTDMPEQKEVSKDFEMSSQPISLPEEVVHPSSIQSPTSPAAADELYQKLSSVKEFWDDPSSIQATVSMAAIFENSMTAGGSLADSSVVQSSARSETEVYNSFSSPSMEMTIPGSMSDNTASMELHTASVAMPSATPNSDDMAESALSLEDSSASVKSGGSGPGKAYVSEQSNVCKVKPQQQQPMSYGMQMPLDNLANLASQSPVYITNQQSSQYLPFQLGSSQLLPQEPRQFSQQPSYSFGLNQQPQAPPPQAPIGQTPFSQSSVFLPTAGGIAQTDLFSGNQLQAAFRSQQQQQQQQGFNQNNQSTIMVSSATSSLMSAGVKPPPAAPNQFFGSGAQKSSALSLPYGQIIGNSTLQPSQQLVLYDTTPVTPSTQPSQPTNVAAPGMGSSQVIGTQIIQHRGPMQPGPSTTFYSQTQQPRLQQTGFYQAQQQQNTNLQGPIQQLTGPAHFTMPGFNTQQQGVAGVAVQPPLAAVLNKAAGPFRPPQQVNTPTTNPQVKMGDNAATISVSMGLAPQPGRMTVQKPPPMHMPMQPPVASSTSVVPPSSKGTKPLSQQPVQRLVTPQQGVLPKGANKSGPGVQTGPRTSLPAPASKPGFQPNKGPRSSVRDMQAKQREELLQQAKSFLNPGNKPAPRLGKGPESKAEEIPVEDTAVEKKAEN